MNNATGMKTSARARPFVDSLKSIRSRILETRKRGSAKGRITVALILTASLSACGVCHVKEGVYRSIGGSETAVELVLKSGNQFDLSGSRWRPGHYESRTTSVLQGTWSCKQNQVILNEEAVTFTGTLTRIGENPLGLDANIKAIVFHSTRTEQSAGIEGEILYPSHELSE